MNKQLWQLIDIPLLLNTLRSSRQVPCGAFIRFQRTRKTWCQDGIESQLEQFAVSSPYTKTDAIRWLTWRAQALHHNDQSILLPSVDTTRAAIADPLEAKSEGVHRSSISAQRVKQRTNWRVDLWFGHDSGC